MENNLYYTPTIEEFHVGFEMETCSWLAKNDRGNWEKYIIEDLGMFMSIYVGDLYDTELRVKYLDQSDIESLGWELKFNEMFGEDKYQINNYIITSIFKNEQILDISLLPLFKGQGLSRVFRGTIKNKSELKKLMQQLNIK